MITKICPRCQEPFAVYPYDEARRVYCSRACKSPPVHRTCVVCGKGFRRRPSEPATTCSHACGHELRRRNFMADAQQALGEPLKEDIERRIAEGQHMQDIARACGFSDARHIYPIMKRLGIARRSRSESVKMQWKDNATRRAAFGQTISEWARNNPEKALAKSLHANLTLQNTSPTSIERRLMDALADAGVRFHFQYVVGDKFLCDFGFPESMLIVECDGTYWHSTPKQRKFDASKDAYLQACGYTVLRLSDKQLEQEIHSCVAAISHLL